MSRFAWWQQLILFVCSWEVIIQIFYDTCMSNWKKKELYYFPPQVSFTAIFLQEDKLRAVTFQVLLTEVFMSVSQIKRFLAAEGSGWFYLGHSTIEIPISLCNLFLYKKPEVAGPALPAFPGLWGWPEEHKGAAAVPGERWSPLSNALSMRLNLKLGKELGFFVVVLVCLFVLSFLLKRLMWKMERKF